MEMFYAVALTIMTAATPLLLAAVGEVVVERSGVLNLGVEGMMIMGAVCGFGAAFYTGSTGIGLIAAIVAGVADVAAVRLSDADAGVEPGGDRTCPDACSGLVFPALSVKASSASRASNCGALPGSIR